MNFRAYRAVLLGVLLTGCASSPVPDLKRLYETRPLPRGPTVDVGDIETPVILVHGAFGARLRNRETRDEVWPGGLGSILFHSYEDIALSVDANTLLPEPSASEAYAITDSAAGNDFYGAIIRTLETAGGYLPGVAGEPITDRQRRSYVFF
jgi:hypothetical protein